MIRLGYPAKITLLAAGAVLSLLGMMDFTGIVHWGTSPYLLYFGYAVAASAIVLMFLDMGQGARIIQQYTDMVDMRRKLEELPEDGYCVDLDGDYHPSDDTEQCDLTSLQTADGEQPQERSGKPGV